MKRTRSGILLPDSVTHTAPLAKGYSEAGGSTTRRSLKGFTPQSGSPREDIDLVNKTMRQRGRLLAMSTPIALAAINTNRTKVVGTGLTLQSSVDFETLELSPEAAKEWQRKTEAEFDLWAKRKDSCDATGMNTFAGLQQLALRSWLASGDVFALVKRYDVTPLSPYALRLHLVEADRVSTPSDYSLYGGVRSTEGENPSNGNKIFDGVEVDASGRVAAYHIRSTYPNEYAPGTPTEWTRVETYGAKTGLANILHMMDAERCDQYRGVTYLAPVIEQLLQLRQYTEAELTGAIVQSYYTAWIKTRTDPTGIPMNEVGAGDVYGAPGGEMDNLSRSENEYEMGPGTVLHLEQDEDVVFGNPNIPTAGFEGFVKTVTRLIGAALEIPYDVLAKEFDASYSASRGALLEAWEAVKMRRAWFADDFCQPVYEIWLAEAIARGRVKAPGFFDDPRIRAAWCRAQWIGPVQGQLDPLKEAKAAIIMADRGFKTHEQLTRELGGGDWESNVERVRLENEKLIGAGGGRYMATLGDEGEDDEGGGE